MPVTVHFVTAEYLDDILADGFLSNLMCQEPTAPRCHGSDMWDPAALFLHRARGSQMIVEIVQTLSVSVRSRCFLKLSLRQTPALGAKLVPSMADAENTLAVSADEDVHYGFKRQEMYTSNLAGTVGSYGRHVFLCYKSHEEWASRVEDEDLPKLLASAVKSRKADFPVETKLTVCEGGESDGDVLIFPDMIKFKALKDSDLETFVDDVLVNGKPWPSGVQEVLAGSYVFVCAHASRDKRCGVCGPALIEKFKQETELRGLSDQIFVKSCSHLGGHKYAGNLVIYSPNSAGKTMGHWYGYVTPDDVSELLDQHIAKGEVIQRLWRGQLGHPAAETEKGGEEQKLQTGNRKEIAKPEDSNAEQNKDYSGGCCQGSNGVSCCREPNSEPVEKKKRTCSQGMGWIGSLDRSEVLVGAAVVGAVATVAIAYSFYRRSV